MNSRYLAFIFHISIHNKHPSDARCPLTVHKILYFYNSRVKYDIGLSYTTLYHTYAVCEYNAPLSIKVNGH